MSYKPLIGFQAADCDGFTCCDGKVGARMSLSSCPWAERGCKLRASAEAIRVELPRVSVYYLPFLGSRVRVNCKSLGTLYKLFTPRDG